MPPAATDATRLSTAPRELRPPTGPRGPVVWLRRGWRQLTSMRTALILLLLLALAVIPGSLLPQRPLNPIKVTTYLRTHTALGPIYARLGLFNVFGSPWFAAIYLLLFISLIGCLIPRCRLHLRALRGKTPPAPRHLDRLPHYATFDTELAAAEVKAHAVDQLRRCRRRTGEEAPGSLTISAERGYLRETGNLIFHLAVILLLISVALGKLYGYSGNVVVDEGSGFCDTVSQFDTFSAGSLVNQANPTPLCVNLKKFTASYDSDGIASQFRADITETTNLAGTGTHRYRLEVNHPLRRDGDRLYLLGHGFSPKFTVRDPSSQVFRRVDAPFLPQDNALTSTGVLKLPDAHPHQLAIEGVFTPTAAFDKGGLLVSASPVPTSPAIAIFVDRGNLGLDSGQPQSVYSIDRTQLATGALHRVAQKLLLPGESMQLKDGTNIRFDGFKQWANLQISHDPAQRWVLVAAVLIVAGLVLSLRVRRRRLWLRITPTTTGSTVAIGALARTDPDGNAREFARIIEHLQAVATGRTVTS